MLKELMEYVVGLRPANVYDENERRVYDKPVFNAPEPLKDPKASALVVASLTSFVDYLAANVDSLPLSSHMIHVNGPDQVSLISELQGFHRQREFPIIALYKTDAPDLIGKWAGLESLTVSLMTMFTAQGDRDELLGLLKSVSREYAEVREDSGLSQAVATKAGVKTLGVGKTANPYQLAPFRMFTEISEQIVSPFVLRLRDGGAVGVEATLMPADGGAWKIEGAKAVAARIEDLLATAGLSAPKVLW